ncbi:MGMT family protein [Candidatus Nomurabacteria bacterium]|nr:MGMT family protein [Candidatus Nomurabacteria bacterium]
MEHVSDFREKVISVVKKIPKGQVLSYKEVAQKAGSPRAYRAVGNIMNTNYDKSIPCHRVVSQNGLGGYNRGVNKKLELLINEGAVIWQEK